MVTISWGGGVAAGWQASDPTSLHPLSIVKLYHSNGTQRIVTTSWGGVWPTGATHPPQLYHSTWANAISKTS